MNFWGVKAVNEVAAIPTLWENAMPEAFARQEQAVATTTATPPWGGVAGASASSASRRSEL
jgi:hypothetical protein